ncbi:MAG: efflux RND transporter periplasmic adaptor subunit [Planctomycetes bacterium]|nr:efflux RND transporter periplasmic adaptor subunit [Planctomycetota bacterium]
MMRFSTGMFIGLLVGGVIAWQPAVDAQERVFAQPSANSIDVAQCRVALIDRVTLASARAGVLAFVEARESDRVRAHQIVAGLDSSVAEASLAVARQKGSSTVERRMARKMIELSQAEYDKAIEANQKVKGGGVFGDIDMRRMKLSVDKSVLQFEFAEQEILVHTLTARQIETELKTYSVEAPFDGIVTRVHRSKGEAVSAGDPLVEVVNLDRVRVEGYVGIVDGLRIKQGATVTVQLDLPDVDLPEEQITFSGKLVFVDVGVEPVSGQIRVWAEVPNPDGILRSGLPAHMKIQIPSVALK